MGFIFSLDDHIPIAKRQKIILYTAAIGWINTGIFPLSYDNQLLYVLHIIPAVVAYVFSGTGLIDLGYHLTNQDGFEIMGFFTSVMGFLTWTFILVGEPTISAELAQLLTIVSFFIWVAVISVIILVYPQMQDANFNR